MTDFCTGQRWLSETETELGLGIIEEVSHRLVTLYFPASEEGRTYAKDNAPLTRIHFKAGDSITTAEGEYWFVVDTDTVDNIIYYEVQAEGNPESREKNPGNAAQSPAASESRGRQITIEADRLATMVRAAL